MPGNGSLCHPIRESNRKDWLRSLARTTLSQKQMPTSLSRSTWSPKTRPISSWFVALWHLLAAQEMLLNWAGTFYSCHPDPASEFRWWKELFWASDVPSLCLSFLRRRWTGWTLSLETWIVSHLPTTQPTQSLLPWLQPSRRTFRQGTLLVPGAHVQGTQVCRFWKWNWV